MEHIVTQEDINILRQGEQEVSLKVELLNGNFKVIESLEGNVVNDSYSQDSESIQRRSYNVDLVVTNSTFSVGRDKKIWIDKRLRVYYGIKSLRTKEVIWYLLGTFAFSTLGYKFNSTSKILSLSCSDLMSLYDGTLNGEIGGYGSSNNNSIATHGLKIPAGEDIRQSIIATLKDAGISDYIVEDIGKPVPYDLTLETGAKYSDIWTKIRDLYDSWEFYFDADGTFVWRKVPTGINEPVMLNNDIMQIISTDENTDIDFSSIYNVTEVWGKVLELDNEDRYADTSTYTDNIYRITLNLYNSWDDIDNLTQFGVKICSDNLSNPQFSVNNYSPIPVYDGNGIPLKEGVLKADTIYLFRYRRLTVNDNGVVAALFLLGQYQCHGIYEEKSKSCPFSTVNLGYQIKQSLDYSNLSDDAACFNQAEYLTYKCTAMQDRVTLTTLVIPWLEVNKKIEYMSKSLGRTNQYIVKSFDWSTGSTMSLVLYRFLEDFSFVWNRKNK